MEKIIKLEKNNSRDNKEKIMDKKALKILIN